MSSFCSGAYTSNDDGKVGLGKSNSLKLPLPDTSIFSWVLSLALSVCLVVFTEKEKLPTAPEKFSGFPSSGKGFMFKTRLPELTLRDISS